MRRAISLPVLLLVLAVPDVSAESNAILVNITEKHLNSILASAVRTHGWPRVTGHKQELSRGVHDFRYEATLSDPVLALGANGAVRLSFDIQQADLRVGRLERRLVRLPLRCENFGLSLDPERHVDVDLGFSFRIEDGGLRLFSEQVSVSSEKKDFLPTKPSRCKHALLPKWLIWQLGKPRLRRRLGDLDGILQGRADEMTDELNGGHGLFHERFEFRGEEVRLSPRWVETGHGSLFLGLDLSTGNEPAEARGPWRDGVPRDPRSFVALSESFLNTLLELTVSEMPAGPQPPGGWLTRLVKSNRIYAMLPGLRALDTTEDVAFLVRMETAPRLELHALEEHAALIRILIGTVEIDIVREGIEGQQLLGTVAIDSGRIGIAPFRNRLGGVSFGLVENEWSVSARGIEQNSELIAAALQETVFGEIFETRYEPLIRKGLSIGPAALEPAYFEVDNGYLFIGLTPRETSGPTSQAKR